MGRSRKQIIEELLDDTERGNIVWVVTINPNYVRAIYNYEITPNKKIVFKLLYFIDDHRRTKLSVDYDMRKEKGTLVTYIMDFGGKTHKNEIKELTYLLNRIILKEEERRKKAGIIVDDIN